MNYSLPACIYPSVCDGPEREEEGKNFTTDYNSLCVFILSPDQLFFPLLRAIKIVFVCLCSNGSSLGSTGVKWAGGRVQTVNLDESADQVWDLVFSLSLFSSWLLSQGKPQRYNLACIFHFFAHVIESWHCHLCAESVSETSGAPLCACRNKSRVLAGV